MTATSHTIACSWRVARGPGAEVYPRHFTEAERPPGVVCNCRQCLDDRTPRVTLWTGATLRDLPFAGIVRFAVTGSGVVVCGDSRTVLHADMVHGAYRVGEGPTLIAGIMSEKRGWWNIWYVQSFDGLAEAHSRALMSRLTTWAEFTRDAGRGVVFLDADDRAAFSREADR